MDIGQIRKRITYLRMKKGVSEYQMSYDLGHSKGYIHNITSGRSMPTMKEFLSICDYFEISPSEFFNFDNDNPVYVSKAVESFQKLSEESQLLVLQLIQKLSKAP